MATLTEFPVGEVLGKARQQNRGMRRFAKRRRTLAAFTAIMARLGTDASSKSPFFKVQYQKLVEDHSPVKRPRNDDTKKSPKSSSTSLNEKKSDSVSYCCGKCGHTQKLKAEELNNIVGNAFRMAYVAQLQRQPILQDVINPKTGSQFRKDKQDTTRTIADVLTKSLTGSDSANNNNSSSENNNVLVGGKRGCRIPTPPASIWSSSDQGQEAASLSSGHNTCTTSDDDEVTSTCTVDDSTTGDMNLQLGTSTSPTLRLTKTPNSIPGLRPSHPFGHNVLSPLDDTSKSISQQSTPSSEESNSPTELNSYKRLADKPPLIKRLTMGLTGGRDALEDDSCPLVSSDSTPTSPTTTRPSSGGYINEAIIEPDTSFSRQNSSSPHHYYYGKFLGPATETLDNTINSAKNFNIENNRLAQSSAVEGDYRTAKRRSQISTSSSSVPADGSMHGSTPTPPPLPERHDSLNKNEEGELRRAPWFQAGIPREITLEVLSQEPEGAFMVRESTSKPGCYALSLRVPRDFQPSGIAHYLIMRTNKGYKIKGFTKEFTTLTSLITHHSVMPELLPCPLSLSRYNPSFVKSESRRDFDDIDSDPDYNTLADFRKMMADLNV